MVPQVCSCELCCTALKSSGRMAPNAPMQLCLHARLAAGTSGGEMSDANY